MEIKQDKKSLRFGLKNSEGFNSPLWRMWVQGNETYLVVRTFIGLSKISLHSTGHWVLAVGTRRVTINGPRGLRDDWKADPRIVFPGVPPLEPLGVYKETTNKPMYLFEDPPYAHWRDFAVLFSKPSASTDDLAGRLPIGSEMIGPLSHRDGTAAWLATFETPMTIEQVEYIRTERDKFRALLRGNLNSLPSMIALLIQDAANGDTMVINILLGRENIVLSES